MKFRYFLIISLVFLMPLFVNAKSYDFYVDEDAKSGGDGSSSKPFQEIEDAIEEAESEGGSQEIYIEHGEYEGDFTVGKSITLVGESESKSIILGPIIMKDNSGLENLTVKGGYSAVTVEKDADVGIDNCTIRDFKKMGINALPGGGKLTMINSKIKNSTGKGVYAQRGKKIEFIGNEITNNDEEGLDLRSKIRGEIRSNQIYKNGESGIEVIVGETEVNISGNTIKDNGSSGIATQFYEDLAEKGDLHVSGNKITGNDNYGITCKKTQGGTTEKSYWRDSIKLDGNTISGNSKGSLYKLCHFEDKTAEVTSESDVKSKDQKQSESAIEKAKREAAEKRTIELRRVEKERKWQEDKIKINEILKKHEDHLISSKNKIQKIEDESRFKIFFFGVNEEQIDIQLRIMRVESEHLMVAKELLGTGYSEMIDEKGIRENIENKTKENKNKIKALSDRKEKFSIWGWIRSWFVG